MSPGMNFPSHGAVLMALGLTIALGSHARGADDLAKPDVTLAGHTSVVLDIAFSPDGKRLASVADDNTLKVWDLAQNKETASISGLHGNQNSVRFTADGKTIVALGSDNNLLITDAETGKPRTPTTLPKLTGGVFAFDLSPDGKTAAIVARGTLQQIDLAGAAAQAAVAVHADHEVAAVAYSADGKQIATAGSDHVATLIDAATNKVIKTLPQRLDGVAVLFSVDGKTLFVSASDRSLQSIDIASGEAKTLIDKGVVILSLKRTENGKMLVVGGPGHSPWIVTLPAGELAEPTLEAEGWIKSVAVSADGKWIAGGSNDGNIFLWKMPAT